MATKSYSKHKEYREYSSSGGSAPGYTDEQFDMIKADLLPKGSKLNSLDRTGGGTREYHYEYKEEKLPSGKYDRKDLHTVELIPKGCKLERGSPGREYCYDYEDRRPGRYNNRNDPNDMFAVEEFTVPPRTVPKNTESNTYYYEREDRELPSVTSGTRTYNYESSTSSTPGYSKVKTSKATKDLSHNVEELDSLLDDLQKDQERQLYKSGYASDTAESTSFDYRKGTPIKAPSSGYSTLKREEHVEKSSWSSSPPPPPVARTAEVRQEVYREEKTESRVIPAAVSPALPLAVPQPVCHHCHHVTNTGTLSRTSTPMNKVTTTVKTYTYEVPADQDPTTVPLPPHADTERTYLSTEENLRTSNTLTRSVGRTPSPSRLTVSPVSPPPGGCQYCQHCNTHREYNTHIVTSTDVSPSPGGCQYCQHCNTHRKYYTHIFTSTDVTDRTNERVVYPRPANEVKVLPSEPHNGHGPHGPTTYKYSETTYSSSNSTDYPRGGGGPPRGLAPSPAPFPRPTTPSPGNQQPPKKLDDLMADFPEARFPTQPDGITRRKVEVTHESQSAASRDVSAGPKTPTGPTVGSKNIAGPAVYYPPGHTPFAKKDTPVGGGGGYEASSAMAAGGGRYAAGRGMYEYESGSRSKEKHSETKTAVPICLPLCCAMPCVIM